MDNMKTGNLIRELRTEKGITQKELAEKLSVSTAAVSKWENGKGFPDISILEPLSEALDISITEIIKGERISGIEETDSLAKDIIEISKKEIKIEKKRKLFIVFIFFFAVVAINFFIIYNAISKSMINYGSSLQNSSLLGIFMFLSGGNAIISGLFNMFFCKKYSLKKAVQFSLSSESFCALSIWIATMYTSNKVLINDISAVLDTANALQIYSGTIFYLTTIINVITFWRISKAN